MDQCQRELRRAAARAFMESLDQLHETLQPAAEPTPPPQRTPIPDPPASAAAIDLDSLEQAVEDIEQFIQQRQTNGVRN